MHGSSHGYGLHSNRLPTSHSSSAASVPAVQPNTALESRLCKLLLLGQVTRWPLLAQHHCPKAFKAAITVSLPIALTYADPMRSSVTDQDQTMSISF